MQTVLDALRARKERFVFEETEIPLKPSTMMFITMNPGYPGRAELPESVKVQPASVRKVDCWATCPSACAEHACTRPAHASIRCCPLPLQALFRPVSMAVPDLALICEIMLMAEGFQESKLLSRKFIILYKLCEDLLSKVRSMPHPKDLRCNAGGQPDATVGTAAPAQHALCFIEASPPPTAVSPL